MNIIAGLPVGRERMKKEFPYFSEDIEEKYKKNIVTIYNSYDSKA